MGLAGAKNRSKIGRDPNNTNWANSTTRFGHRVLRSQGWTPGSTLGAINAAHSAHYTAASSSHIRAVQLGDGNGNGGVGAKRSREEASQETFGLALLSGLLGRLNGKSEEALQKEAGARRDVGLMRYQEGVWGSVGFVFGGYLVGDRIEETIERVEESRRDGGERLKKRKRAGAESAVEATDRKDKPAKRSKKSDKPNSKSKSKTQVKEEAKSVKLLQSPAEESSSGSESSDSAKCQRKAEKRARKEARRLKKEQKRLKKAQKEGNTSTANPTDLVQSANDRDTSTAAATPVQSTTSVSTPLFTGGRGRHAIRHKYIQQKQMACMDDKALNEIFMIRSNA